MTIVLLLPMSFLNISCNSPMLISRTYVCESPIQCDFLSDLIICDLNKTRTYVIKLKIYFFRILIVSTSVSISSIVLLIMPSTNKFRKRLSEAVIAITGFLFA